jgi:hypothetical protein
MARTSEMWWPWLQRQLDARDWRPADLAREIRTRIGHGPDESVIGRWKNKGSAPTRESVIAVAEALHVDVRKALIAAGMVTASELDAPWADPSRVDLTSVPDEALAEEVLTRLVRRTNRRHQPAAASIGVATGRTTMATSSSEGSRHSVPTDSESAPPSSGEGEGAEVDAHCA